MPTCTVRGGLGPGVRPRSGRLATRRADAIRHRAGACKRHHAGTLPIAWCEDVVEYDACVGRKSTSPNKAQSTESGIIVSRGLKICFGIYGVHYGEGRNEWTEPILVSTIHSRQVSTMAS